jgi:hypothetical protein
MLINPHMDTTNPVDNNTEELLLKIATLEKALVGSVPKQKLADETLQERLQWLYHDFTPFQRFLAQCIMMILVGGVSFAVYMLADKIAPEGNITEAIEMLIALATALLGLGGQASFMKLPDEKMTDQ